MKLNAVTHAMVLAFASAAILVGSSSLAAEPESREISEAAPPNLVAPKSERRVESNVQFSGLKLTGRLKKPDLSYIYRRRGLRSEQIVNIPENFNEEIRQGAGRF